MALGSLPALGLIDSSWDIVAHARGRRLAVPSSPSCLFSLSRPPLCRAMASPRCTSASLCRARLRPASPALAEPPFSDPTFTMHYGRRRAACRSLSSQPLAGLRPSRAVPCTAHQRGQRRCWPMASLPRGLRFPAAVAGGGALARAPSLLKAASCPAWARRGAAAPLVRVSRPAAATGGLRPTRHGAMVRS